METLTNPRGPSDLTAAAAHRWVMLNRNILKDSGSSAADAKTTAATRTSSGIPFSVSLSIAAPPEASSFHYNLLGGVGTTPSRDNDEDTNKDLQLQIVAAHDDSVLIESRVPRRVSYEYFLYEAAAGRRPSLYLLPGCYFSQQFERDKDARQVPTLIDYARSLSCFKDTGILRLAEGDVLVAQLEVGYEALYSTAELCVFHGPSYDWVLKKGLPIVHHEGDGQLHHRPQIDATVPIGNRFLCWVDYHMGFVLCDMVEENPRLRYVPLPVLPAKTYRRGRDRPDLQYCRNLAAAGPSTVRFVSVAPRCCCGGPGKTSCERSNFAFNVTTWSLNLKTDEPMVWVKDGVLDCDELWQLPNYGGLPRVAPKYPILSCDDPDVMCFMVCENHYFIDDADETVWMVEINTKSKALLSVVHSDSKYYDATEFLPAKLHW